MEITIKLYAVIAFLSLYGFCQALACADCLLLWGRYVVVYALISVVVCVGVIDTWGCLRTGGGQGWVYGCWDFKRVSNILLGKIVELSFRWLFLMYSV